LDGLRHHAVVRGDHEDRDIGDLRTARTHGGERLVTRGVDEGDRAVLALVLGVDLVGTDVLGDATGLVPGDVGLPDRVQQRRLSVVDVTHDGDHRRAGLEVLVGLGGLLGLEVDVEALEELAVLLLGGHDLDDVAELGAQRLEGVLVERLGRRRHLTEVEQHGHQACRVGVDAVREVGQRGAGADPDDGVAVTAGDGDAAERRRTLLLELEPLRALALATTGRTTAGATERALRATTTATAATATAAEATAGAGTTRTAAAETATGTAAAATAATTAATATTGGRAGTTDRGPVGHHARRRARTTGARGRRAR